MSTAGRTFRIFAKLTRNSTRNLINTSQRRCRITTTPAPLRWPASNLGTTRAFATTSSNTGDDDALLDSPLDSVTYDRVCTATLDALCDYFEELTENAYNIQGSDVAYSDGVLTVNLGGDYGTYVINRQSPNKQIWLSSPTSGPKRYDFVGPKSATSGAWIYKHTGDSMHNLLQRELQPIFKDQLVNFLQLPCVS